MLQLIKRLLAGWNDWTGDHYLKTAIQRELRRQGLVVIGAKTRDVQLIAIQRPGWVQVRSFYVETLDRERTPVRVLGLARDDSREEKIDVLITDRVEEFVTRRDAWSTGMIRRGRW